MKRISTLIIALLLVLLPVQAFGLSTQAILNSALDYTNSRLRLKIEAYDSTANNVSLSEEAIYNSIYDSTTKALTVSLTGELAFTGDQTMTGDLTVTGDTALTGDLTVSDATGELLGVTSSEITVNEASQDINFRIEGDGETNLLFVDAGLDRVGIGTANLAGAYMLYVAGNIRGSIFKVDTYMNAEKVLIAFDTIAADDTTPSVDGGNYFVTSANTGATEILDLDDPAAGQLVVLVCGSTTNASTITDGGNFALSANWAPDSVGDNLTLIVYADNTYYELSRSDN